MPSWRALPAGLACAGLLALSLPPFGWADIYGGGGSVKKDCLLVFDAPVNHPLTKPRRVRCTDGDAACDSDATVNGVCVVAVTVCANSTFNAQECTLVGLESSLVDHSLDNGDPKFDPDFQALQARIDDDLDLPNSTQDDCAGVSNITVPVKGPFPNKKCRKGKKKIKIDSESVPMSGKRLPDRDKLKIECLPAPDMCDPLTIFSGTLDRIQRQVFNGTCATGGCHDSQSLSGNLTLEEGSSHGALVDVDPDNAAAMAAGWRRVFTTGPTSGDPSMSFLYRKLTGELEVNMGERMPLNQSKIKSAFRDMIELWILDGAPETGWVPGTDN